MPRPDRVYTAMKASIFRPSKTVCAESGYICKGAQSFHTPGDYLQDLVATVVVVVAHVYAGQPRGSFN